VEPGKTAIARQRFSRHVPVAMNTHATIEQLLEVVWFIPRIHNVNQQYSNAKYLGAIFNKRTTRILHIEINEAKAFRTFIRIYSLFERVFKCQHYTNPP
jgi:hypothetical protein